MIGISLSTSCTQKTAVQQVSVSDVIRIGEVSSLSGNEATIGIASHRGALLAIQDINEQGGIHGKKLELITLDDQGKPDETAAAVTKLITQHHVTALTGGLPSSRALAMAPIAQKFKIPFVSPSGTNPHLTEAGDQIFRVCFIDPFQGQVMAKFALKNLKITRVALMRDIKSDYSFGLSESFIQAFKAGGGEIVTEQSLSSGDIDFKSQLTALRPKNAQALFLPIYYTEAALIARQMKELGMNLTILGGDGLDSPKYAEIGQEAVNATYFSTHYASDQKTPQVQAFVTKFKKAYGGAEPDGLSTLGYDAILVLADAMKRAPSLQSNDLTAALASTSHFPGITGSITLDNHRNPIKPAIIIKLENGQPKFFTSIEP